MQFIKELLRKILSSVTYHLFYRLIRQKLEVTPDGQPLKPGIAAVVAAKNESYTISFCLKSLIDIVDQIVCIDNGSKDDTLKKMHDFKNQYGNKIEVEIISLPDGLLGDCREAGLKATKYQWHLRWDADMVANTKSMVTLRKKVLQNNRPRAIRLPRIHLYGDLSHTSKYLVVDPGEPILIRFNKQIYYKEYGKFDAIKMPIYYQILNEKEWCCFHCAGLKSDDNLMHRFHYFTWRECYNNATSEQEKKTYEDFEQFKFERNLELFGTNERKSLKYRYQRQLALHFIKYNPDKYAEYPEILKHEMKNNKERFKVIYRDGKPDLRIDNEDAEMLNYKPTKEDMAWDPKKFLKRFSNDKENSTLSRYIIR